MAFEHFIATQRKGINIICVLFVALVTFMWLATLLDWAFSLGWNWDPQILWLGPLMIMFAGFVRFCAFAIFRFVGSGL